MSEHERQLFAFRYATFIRRAKEDPNKTFGMYTGADWPHENLGNCPVDRATNAFPTSCWLLLDSDISVLKCIYKYCERYLDFQIGLFQLQKSLDKNE